MPCCIALHRRLAVCRMNKLDKYQCSPWNASDSCADAECARAHTRSASRAIFLVSNKSGYIVHSIIVINIPYIAPAVWIVGIQ
eukprot:6184561-Pleurochrysis_carterae.AAC.2